MARLVGRVTRKSSTRSLRISESRKLLYLKVVNTPQIPKLDPWQSNHYHPISKEGEGEGEEGGDQKQEVESSSSLQNFLLHHIHQLQQQQQQQPPVPNKKPSRLPAHGGRIVRSTGRKDRHSKVSTAKGLRDRRVRLAAHTAIKFYDVQDRLGYDRPSKAVDWLIKNAKSAIDQLAELPPWNPETVTTSTTQDDHLVQVQEQVQQNNAHNQQNFLLFPDDHYNPPDLLSRTSSSHVQDLRLSLQSFQESATPPTQSLFSASSNLAFDANSVMPWNTTSDGSMFMSQFYTQREPLQSSNDPVGHQLLHPSIFHLTSSSSSPIIGGAFSGYRIPEMFQGKQEHDSTTGYSADHPASASSASQY